MGSLTDYSGDTFLEHVLGIVAWNSPPASVWMGLSTTPMNEDGSGFTEVSGDGYGRAQVTFAAPSGTERGVTNTGVIQFPTSSASWGLITNWAIFDQEAAGGDPLAHGDLASGKTVIANKSPSFADGVLTVSMNTGKMSTYLVQAMLNHIFRNTPFTQPANLYMGLAVSPAIADSDAGGDITEFSMTGYARQDVKGGTVWNDAAVGASDNKTVIDYGTLTGAGQTINAGFLSDNSGAGAGNILLYDNSPSVVIDTDDIFQIPVGDATASIL